MSLIPKDMTPIYKATIAKGTSGMRWQRPVYVEYLPPCNSMCPAGENIQAWLGLAQAGRYEEAWQKYMEENPLPGTHGRACYHPCESVCNRKYLDQSVSIHSLDRFLGDLAIKAGWRIRIGPPTGKRVLVVGAGPGGLSCAYHLRRMGHGVEIRDASPAPGGMMRYGIPAYRLPRDGLSQEIDRILAMGAEVTCNYRVDDVLAEKEAGRLRRGVSSHRRAGREPPRHSGDGRRQDDPRARPCWSRSKWDRRPSSAGLSESSAAATRRWMPRALRRD